MVKQKSPPSPAPGRRGRRAIQAEQTRAEILGAARRRFAADGYAATSVKDIAAEAGVSVQTVYDSVGAKADLVRRLNDLVDAEAEVGEIAATIETETDPVALAAIAARVTRRIIERCGDIVRASYDGARAEPDLAPVAIEGGRRHRAGAAAIAARLSSLGALRPDLTAEAATTTIAALAETRLAFVLLDDHGLDLDELERWIASTTTVAVLADT